MTEVVEDLLEPPRFKHKKIPHGPPSPPPPVICSPPQKAIAQYPIGKTIKGSPSLWTNDWLLMVVGYKTYVDNNV